jgi:hypothetical protein
MEANNNLTAGIKMAQDLITIQQFFAHLEKVGRLMDHRFAITVTRSGMEDFTLFGQSTSVPARTVNKAPIHYFGQQIDLPSTLDEGRNWSCELFTDEENVFYNRIREWQDEYASWRRSGGGFKGISSINGYIDFYNNAMTKIVDTIVISNIWPSEVGALNLDMTGDGFVTFSTDFSFVSSFNSRRGSNPLR